MAASGLEPNAENKLFVGGCPPGSNEAELRELFEQHGTVEEVFVMRGGSRSGMVCAFVRFTTQQMAQSAIDAIHGQHILPQASEPLVVRWADAPGTRKREGRDSSRRRGGGGARDAAFGAGAMAHAAMGGYAGYPMQHMMMMGQPAAYGSSPFYAHQPGVLPVGSYGGISPPNSMGYPPQMMSYMGQQGMGPQPWTGTPLGQVSPQMGMMGMLPAVHAHTGKESPQFHYDMSSMATTGLA